MRKTSHVVVLGCFIAGLFACGGVDGGSGDGGVNSGVDSGVDGGVDGGILPVSITTQPSNQVVTAPATATFTVAATGVLPPIYQWKKNGSEIAGATSASYTTPPTSLADNGAVFNVVVSNSLGNVTSNAATLSVNPPVSSALFAYVANQSDNTLSAFSVNRTTGALSALSPATYSTDMGPQGVASAQGKFLYVGCSGKVDAFRVNLGTGALTSLPGSPYTVAGINGSGMAVSPDGNYLYAAGSATRVYSFQIQSDGTLAVVAGSPFSSGIYPVSRLSTAGRFLFGAAETNVLVFRTNAGAITAPDHQPAANSVYDFVATPDGHYAYAADYSANVKAYTVDLVTGIMTQQAGVYTAQLGFSTRGAVVNPSGNYLYVLNRGGDITRFSIAANGSLSPATGTVTSTGLNEVFEHIVMDPDGKFLYLTNTLPAPHNFVLGFTVNASTGTLTQMPAGFLGGVNEQGMAFIKVP